MQAIDIREKFNLFSERWTPKIIGELNGQYVKLAKVKDAFVWHSHENEDELFMVFKGFSSGNKSNPKANFVHTCLSKHAGCTPF